MMIMMVTMVRHEKHKTLYQLGVVNIASKLSIDR